MEFDSTYSDNLINPALAELGSAQPQLVNNYRWEGLKNKLGLS